MWKKSNLKTKFGFGSKVTVLVLLLLLVACSQVLAWPSFITGVKTEDTQSQILLEAEKQELQAQVNSQLKSLDELQKKLQEQEIQLQEFQSASPEFQSLVKEAGMQSAMLLEQIESLKKSLNECEIAYDDLEADYASLQEDYAVKEDEANTYFQDLAKSQAELKAVSEGKPVKQKNFGVLVGAHAVMKELSFGIGGDIGIRYKNFMLLGSVDYAFKDFDVKNIKKTIVTAPGVMTYKLGIGWMF